MTNKIKATGASQTKKALTSSVISLVLCFAMLLGTTYAWFTDTVVSGTNEIYAGNLDIEFKHTNKRVSNADVDGTTELFRDVTLWEPGAYAYEVFTVKNAGSLALKYQLSILDLGHNTVYDAQGNDTGLSLLDVLRIKVIDGDAANDSSTEGYFGTSRPSLDDGALLSAYIASASAVRTADLAPQGETGDSKTATVVIYWPENGDDNNWNLQNGKYASDAGSDKPGKLKIDFAVKLVATQQTHESDSFGTDYDEGIEYPVITASTVKAGTATVLTAEAARKYKVTVPAGSENASENDVLYLRIENETVSTDTEGNTTVSFELSVINQNGEKVTNASGMDVEIQLPSQKNSVTVIHNNEEITNKNYNPATGVLTFKTSSFSPFYVIYNSRYTADAEIKDEEDTVLTAGNFTVTVPASAAKKDGAEKLTLIIDEYSEDEANDLGTFAQPNYKPEYYNFKYFDIKIEGLADDNTERLQIQYTLPVLDEGLTYYPTYTQVYLGTAKSNLTQNTSSESYAIRATDGSQITTYSATLGCYSVQYVIWTGSNPNVDLSATMANGSTATARIGYGAYVFSPSISDLVFSFEKYDITDEELAEIYPALTAMYGFDETNTKVSAYKYSFKNFHSLGSNNAYITFPYTINEEYIDAYYISSGGARKLQFSDGKIECGISRDTEGLIYIFYTFETQATKELKSAAESASSGDTITITSADNGGDLAQAASALSGKSNLTLTGSEDGDTVKSTNAIITANGLTLKDLTLVACMENNGGLRIAGNNTKISNVQVEASSGIGTTLRIDGSNSTVENSTITAIRGGSNRYSALEFQNDTADSVTNVVGCTITPAYSYFSSIYDVTDTDQLRTLIAGGWGQKPEGIIFRSTFRGTLNVKNTTIDVPTNALYLGIDGSAATTSKVNVNDSAINTGSMSFTRIGTLNFTNSTFKNDWNGDSIAVSIGDIQYYSSGVKVNFSKCNFDTKMVFTLSSGNNNKVVFDFADCTYDGVAITEENILDFLSVNYYATSSSIKLTIEGTTVTAVTVAK